MLTAEEADGRVITTTSFSEVIVIIEDPSAVNAEGSPFDFSQIAPATVSVTLKFTQSGVLNPSTLLGDAVLKIDAEKVLELDGLQANKSSFAGEGTVKITGSLSADSTDLTSIIANISFEGDSLDLNGKELVLTAAQFEELVAQLQGFSGTAGTLILGDLAADVDIDTASIAGSNLTVKASVDASSSVDLSSADLSGIDELTVTGAETVIISASSFDSQSLKILGDGDFILSNNLSENSSLDLSEFTGDFSIENNSLALGASSSLVATAAQINGKNISGTGDVVLSGNAAGVDFSGIAVSGDGLSVSVADETDLFLTSGQAFTLSGGSSTVPISGGGGLQLSGTATGLEISRAAFQGSELSVVADALVVVDADQLNEIDVSVLGTLEILNLDSDAVDLSGISLDGGSASISLASTAVALDLSTKLGFLAVDVAAGQQLTSLGFCY